MELKKLSDKDLLQETKSLAAQEREILLQILQHLKEIDRRKLYLEIGYGSLWAYCTEELQYSEASAQRRIEAMRAIRELPALESKIESGVLSLSNVAKAQGILRKSVGRDKYRAKLKHSSGPDNSPDLMLTATQKFDIFCALENKSQKEAEVILATHFPEEVRRDEKVRVLGADSVEIKLIASAQLLEKLEKVKELFSHLKPGASLVETLELMADFVIAKKDPSAKSAEPPRAKTTMPPQRRSEVTYSNFAKYIPAARRREVWRKAGGCCEFADSHTQRRCSSRYQLEIEHVNPRAFGGDNDLKNLKLYCRAHNRHAARQATLLV